MKRIVLMSMMMVGLLYTGQLSALENKGQIAAPENKGPKIEIKEMRYDLGKVVQGTKVSHIFEVKNVGSEQLVIQKVQPS
jgi:Protein of unknown function (DUF1573)